MSFASSRTILEPSFQFSKKISGKAVDPKAPMRLVFPVGWENKDSAAFKWYDAQPHKFFRQIRYYKERQGVGHEFVVLPLQDVDGNPTDWFCRLERTADPSQQLRAISAEGTEAFDYVQSFEGGLLEYFQDSGLIAEITLPRNFDLYDVLAICSSIAEHPRACRDTLQQFNCYFFSWTIVLSLTRRAANWENLSLRHMNEIKELILSLVAVPAPSDDAKIAHMLSAAHSSDTDSAHSSLATVLESELSNHEFSRCSNLALGSVLWAHRGHAQLKASLEGRSVALAERTIELLVGGVAVDPDASVEYSERGDITTGANLDLQVHQLEGSLFFIKTSRVLMIPYLREETSCLKKNFQNNRNGPDKVRFGWTWYTPAVPFKATATLSKVYKELTLGTSTNIVIAARLQSQLSVYQNRSEVVCLLQSMRNQLLYLPRCGLHGCKLGRALGQIARMEPEEEGDVYATVYERCILHALGLTVAKLLEGIEERDGHTVRAVVVNILVSIAKVNVWLDHRTLKEMWDRLLWDFVGDIITGATLKVALAEEANGIDFNCLQPTEIKEPLPERPEFESTPITDLQQFIEERIVWLTKHDIDHAPIIQHIPLPAMDQPYKSQNQMKNALEEIWRTARLGNRFRGGW